ncbi:MAG: SIR2 family protein [Candidatus Acidiferrales bacterium]
MFEEIIKKDLDLEFLLEELQDLERKVRKHFKPLLDLVTSKLAPRDPVIIFTTNYDPAIELLCSQCSDEFELRDGFEFDPLRRDSGSPHTFNDKGPAQSRKRVVILVKLHGPTNWFTDDGQITRGPNVFADEDQDHHKVLIYPAKRKVAIDEPFFTADFCLHEVLSHARCLLSIGYSFRDYDALTRIMSAQRRNPLLRMVVVKPDADRIDGELTFRGLDFISSVPRPYDPSDSKLTTLS